MSCSVAKATFLVHVSVGRATSDLRIEKLTAVGCSIPRWYHFNIARRNLTMGEPDDWWHVDRESRNDDYRF
ncbi:MAG: hypothetical protein VCB59_03490, partial [Gammaproteobacteria bacterium]